MTRTQITGNQAVDADFVLENELDSGGVDIQIKSYAGDKGSPANGDIWYNSTSGKFRVYQDGTATDWVGTGGGGSSALRDSWTTNNSFFNIGDTNANVGWARNFTASASYVPDSVELYLKAVGGGKDFIPFIGIPSVTRLREIVWGAQVNVSSTTAAWVASAIHNASFAIVSGKVYTVGAIMLGNAIDGSNYINIGVGTTTADYRRKFDESTGLWGSLLSNVNMLNFKIDGVLT